MALSDYKERPRITKIPWGYKAGPEWAILVPDLDLLSILDQCLDQLDAGIPIRHAHAWYVSNLPEGVKPLSTQGLWKTWSTYRPDHPRKVPRVKKKRQTYAERTRSIKKKKLHSDKLIKRFAEKRIEKLEAELAPKKPVDDLPTLVEELTAVQFEGPAEDEYIIFKPNEGPQTEFLMADELEVLYGGAAGGGKSYAMLADPMRYFGNPNFNGILLRRTNDELRELIWKSQDLYPKAFPGSRWSEKRSAWRFPAGGNMWFTYLERDEDVRRYQGQAFCWIGFDELTQYPTPFPWNYLRSRLRTTDSTLPLCMRATSNPGGVGHGWVKRMFVDPAPWNTPFYARDLDTDQILVYPEGHKQAGEPLFERRFIPAKVKDNPYLWEDGMYERNLLSLPENQRKQLLEGDWGIADGAAFPEFRQHLHVVKPFPIDPSWRRFRSCDYGYASHSAVHWFAIEPITERLIVYRELYVTRKTGVELGNLIQEKEDGENISYGVLDSATWQVRGQTGPSVAEEILASGCRFRPTDKGPQSRAHGFQRLHELLKVNPDTGYPGIVFFENCRQIIADLPVIPVNPDGKDDIDEDYASDHAYDSVRYGAMSRPRSFNLFDFGSDGPNGATKSAYRPSSPIFGY